ncbi:MAG: alginate export family protein [Spirosomataceae bacterium]
MKPYYYGLILTIIFPLSGFGQELDVHADLRLRYEFRNGYGTLRPDSAKAAHFITQRNRIKIDYSDAKLKLRISPQNVRVWGDMSPSPQRSLDMHFHEAWAELAVNRWLSLKLGRQELDYADARILGNADWGMQARSHDVFLARLKPDTLQEFHFGMAINALRESNFQENYGDRGYFRTMQFGWYHLNTNNLVLNLMILNQGIPYPHNQGESLAWNQTWGGRVVHKEGRWHGELSSYLQTGKLGTITLNAWQIALLGSWALPNGWKVLTGYERMSGQKPSSNGSTIRSFTPWYGTNHKFNGHMDYFYVGNHKNSVGLADYYVSLEWRKSRFSALLTGHYFESAVEVENFESKKLGLEIDATLRYSIRKDIQFSAGYSQISPTTLLETIKGTRQKGVNNWAFVALHFQPRLFHHIFPKN